MPVSLKARPYLVLCIAFDFKILFFELFCAIILFFSERAFAIATKVPLRHQV